MVTQPIPADTSLAPSVCMKVCDWKLWFIRSNGSGTSSLYLVDWIALEYQREWLIQRRRLKKLASAPVPVHFLGQKPGARLFIQTDYGGSWGLFGDSLLRSYTKVESEFNFGVAWNLKKKLKP